MQVGRFICLEGIEGVGKTTQVNFIRNYLNQRLDRPILTTREPGGTELAESIRQLILSAKDNKEAIAPETELFLLFAARRQHIIKVIQPAIEEGQWVLCDRFTEASYAYQGAGRNLSIDLIKILERHTHQKLTVDRVILLDMPVQAALDRLKKRSTINTPVDRIEKESFEFFHRVRNSYLERAESFSDLYRVIEANTSLKQVERQIEAILDELLKQ